MPATSSPSKTEKAVPCGPAGVVIASVPYDAPGRYEPELMSVPSGGRLAAVSRKTSAVFTRSALPPASAITIAVVPDGDCSTISRSSGNVCDRISDMSTPRTRAVGDAPE